MLAYSAAGGEDDGGCRCAPRPMRDGPLMAVLFRIQPVRSIRYVRIHPGVREVRWLMCCDVIRCVVEMSVIWSGGSVQQPRSAGVVGICVRPAGVGCTAGARFAATTPPVVRPSALRLLPCPSHPPSISPSVQELSEVG